MKKEINFRELQEKVEAQFNKISTQSDFLYKLNLEKNELWDIYLESFPEGTNKIFRERREHDCSACRGFVNNFGDVVGIVDNKIVSIWDFDINDDEYSTSIKAMAKHIKGKPIKDVYVTKFRSVGTKQNHEDYEGKILTWSHFYVTLPNKYVTNSSESLDTIKGEYRSLKDVFKRSLEELSQDSVETVLELIAQGSLYKGDEWKNQLTDFAKYQKEYEKLSESEKDIYVWNMSMKVGAIIGKIRNHSIGVLLINITEGMDLDVAVRKYEQIVAPTNYKRPKPIYTKKMLEDAKKKLEELGFMDSLQRRYAILEDISINNVLFSNKSIVKRLQNNDVFDEMENEIAINPKSFDRVEEITMNDFIENVLPTVKNIEVFLEGKHASNMVSLIAPYKSDSKTMFKWDNNFSWAYSGNITDSDMKRNVKNAGGKVDGVLRFSIQWNELNTYNKDDYDAHCIEPNRNEIYFRNKGYAHQSSGILDVDIINPQQNTPAVENITWSNINRMHKGTYKFFVHNYANRGGSDGFRAEIEFNGQLYKFEYNKPLKHGENVQVAEVTFDGENFTIKELLQSDLSTRSVWNVKTNQFVPVSTVMYSPNYWNSQDGIGNKHYFFMLKDCISDENPNGFFNEYLNNDLIKHRKVFEALGSKMKVDTIDNQLSGIGFSSTQRNQVIVRVEGQTKRLLKIRI